MAATDDILTRPQLDEALAGLPDWRYRLGALVTVYKAPTAAAALQQRVHPVHLARRGR